MRKPRATWPPALRTLIDDAGVTLGYLTRGLLSIHRFAPDVRQALAAGLPFAVARLVNGLPTTEARARALAPLDAAAGRDGALLPRGVSAAVERLARAERRALEAERPAEAPRVDEDRWVLPEDAVRAPRRMVGDVWLFEPVAGAAASEEPLAERVVEALLARTLPNGGDLVDATAGRGTIASVARRHGVRCWSGDVVPGAPFVVEADARELLTGAVPGIARHCADLLVLHPPTFATWAASSPHADGGLDAYRDEVGAMLAGSLGVVRPGGFVAVIARPVRERGAVWLATSHLAESLADTGAKLEAYVVAVDAAASEDWLVLLARVPDGA
ncbi:MAG: hypothetical protein P1P87_07115 [Trueperaceae bacterium]|nr:hypothetical protein [Trueperaceae bacterium]